jgi:hypothetical protein
VSDALFAMERTPFVVTRRLPLPAGTGLRLAPCTISAANEVVLCWHRHSTPITQKVLCAVRCVQGAETVGVAILGLPVSRVLDDGLAVEVRRVCVQGGAPRNACSMLYGAMCRAAAALGYEDAYTYTMASEAAASVRAAGFVEDGRRSAANWDTPSRPRDAAHHEESERVRWLRRLR